MKIGLWQRVFELSNNHFGYNILILIYSCSERNVDCVFDSFATTFFLVVALALTLLVPALFLSVVHRNNSNELI